MFQTLMNKSLVCNVNLFANSLNTRLDKFYSWIPDPEAEAYNALLNPWVGIRGYAFPFLLNISVPQESAEREINNSNSNTSLASPTLVFKSNENVYSRSHSSPNSPSSAIARQGVPHPLIVNNSFQLVGWVVSGNPRKRCSYLQKLKNLILTHEERVYHLTIQPEKSGLAGVSEGRLIHFLLHL